MTTILIKTPLGLQKWLISHTQCYGHSLITVKLPGSLRGQISLAGWKDCTYIFSPLIIKRFVLFFLETVKKLHFSGTVFRDICRQKSSDDKHWKYKKVQMFLNVSLLGCVCGQPGFMAWHLQWWWRVVSLTDEKFAIFTRLYYLGKSTNPPVQVVTKLLLWSELFIAEAEILSRRPRRGKFN